MSEYIKREDAYAAVQAHFDAGMFKSYDDGQRLMDRITAIPAADVVERKCGNCLPKARYFYCSECGYAVADVYEGAYDHDDEKVLVFEKGESWSYCPNCGADMRKGGDT